VCPSAKRLVIRNGDKFQSLATMGRGRLDIWSAVCSSVDWSIWSGVWGVGGSSLLLLLLLVVVVVRVVWWSKSKSSIPSSAQWDGSVPARDDFCSGAITWRMADDDDVEDGGGGSFMVVVFVLLPSLEGAGCSSFIIVLPLVVALQFVSSSSSSYSSSSSLDEEGADELELSPTPLSL